MISRTLKVLLAVLAVSVCTTLPKDPQERNVAAVANPSNPFAWNSWFKKRFPNWYFASSRLEQDPRPWPKPFRPEKDSVYAHNEVFIPAITPQEVFQVMTRSSRWPEFYPNSDQPHVTVDGHKTVLESLQANSDYEWTTFGVAQHMKITEFKSDAQESLLAWTGGSVGTSVYHRWIMRAFAGGTQVITEECEQGLAPFLDHALMNPALHAGHQLWLENLKKFILHESLSVPSSESRMDANDEREVFGLNLSWFDREYAKSVESKLADGVYASIGAGGNSLIVTGESEAILIDTKVDLPYGLNNGATKLHQWIQKNIPVPVTKIVNTHYHYDHTFGNHLYGAVQVYSRPEALDLMRHEDKDWWQRHTNGFPNKMLTEETTILKAGTHQLEVHYSLSAHTKADVWIYLPAENIVMLGDLMFHTYYPFFDEHGNGSSLTGTIKMLQSLAQKYPTASFLPGHGPVCKAADVLKYAEYLEAMDQAIQLAKSKGLNEVEAVNSFDLSQWPRRVLPSLHNGSLEWATARSSFLGAFRAVNAP